MSVLDGKPAIDPNLSERDRAGAILADGNDAPVAERNMLKAVYWEYIQIEDPHAAELIVALPKRLKEFQRYVDSQPIDRQVMILKCLRPNDKLADMVDNWATRWLTDWTNKNRWLFAYDPTEQQVAGDNDNPGKRAKQEAGA